MFSSPAMTSRLMINTSKKSIERRKAIRTISRISGSLHTRTCFEETIKDPSSYVTNNGAFDYYVPSQEIAMKPRSLLSTPTNFAEILEDPASLMTYNSYPEYRRVSEEY
mmetsp:Transcript_9071/g.11156  ORF Transcript_9071/g.11156 Transcript_9071/m.11156 type:complete len:109 (-) Transcript_9071:286-612(-)